MKQRKRELPDYGGTTPPIHPQATEQRRIYANMCVQCVFMLMHCWKMLSQEGTFYCESHSESLKNHKRQRAWKEPLKVNTDVKLPLSNRITNTTLLLKCFHEAHWASSLQPGQVTSPVGWYQPHWRKQVPGSYTYLLKARKGQSSGATLYHVYYENSTW